MNNQQQKKDNQEQQNQYWTLKKSYFNLIKKYCVLVSVFTFRIQCSFYKHIIFNGVQFKTYATTKRQSQINISNIE